MFGKKKQKTLKQSEITSLLTPDFEPIKQELDAKISNDSPKIAELEVIEEEVQVTDTENVIEFPTPEVPLKKELVVEVSALSSVIQEPGHVNEYKKIFAGIAKPIQAFLSFVADKLVDQKPSNNQQQINEQLKQIAQLVFEIKNASKANAVTNISLAVSDITMSLENAISSIKEIENSNGKIQAINKQTNLLSLNATIESAKAGDAGKGFAVVADEVRQVSKEINNLSNEMNARISTVSESVNRGYDALAKITSLGDSAIDSEKLTKLENLVVGIAKLLSENASNNSGGFEYIKAALDEVSQILQQVSRSGLDSISEYEITTKIKKSLQEGELITEYNKKL